MFHMGQSNKVGSGKVINVALIGSGEVAMLIHLPTLMYCSHMFKPVALVDISQEALDHCSKKFHVPKTFTDVGEMLKACPEVELVMIINSSEYHVQHALLSLKAGKDVFIEKPMSMTLEGADEIEAARKASGKIVFVGTMRRFATAFLRIKERVQALKKGEIAYVRVRDIIGHNAYFTAQTGAFPLYPSDYPAHLVDERKKLNDQLCTHALGEKGHDAKNAMSWGLLTGLGTHDISAMRELIGMPQKVLAAARSPDGMFIWATFQYPGFVAYYETGIDKVKIFDAHIELYTTDTRMKVNYDTPFIKGLPITATIQSTKEGGDFSEELIRPTYEDAYTLEYKALYEALTNGGEVKTGPLDSKQDLEIFKMIMDAMVDV